MEFSDNKPIYRQIVEYAYTRILDGAWRAGELIPSVREMSATLGVNSRTVLRAMDDLQQSDIIVPKRGMGFLLSGSAVSRILEEKRKEFFDRTLPQIGEEMKRLGITPGELIERLR